MQTSAPVIYHTASYARRWYRVVLTVAPLLSLPAVIFSAWTHQTVRLIVYLLCFAGGAASALGGTWRITLTVSPQGVQYRVPGGMLFAPWAAVAPGSVRYLRTQISGITVAGGQWQRSRWTWWTPWWWRLFTLSRTPFIPLDTYAGAYWEPAAYTAMRAYAPWVPLPVAASRRIFASRTQAVVVVVALGILCVSLAVGVIIAYVVGQAHR